MPGPRIPREQNEARVQLARMAAASQDWDEASRQTNAVLAEDPKNVAALGTRAAVYLNNGKNAEAIDDLISALNEAPDSANLVQLLGEAYERTGEVALAQEQYSKALSISGNAPGPGLQLARFLLRYGKAEQAERVLEKVRAGAPADRQVLGLLAELKLRNSDWVGAQEIAEALRALDEEGTSNTADNILAAALSGLNRSAESISILRSSLSKSGDPTVLGNLVRAYVQAGKLQEAVDLLKAKIQSDPANVQAIVLLGSVYMVMNQPDLAETSFKNAVAVDEKGTLGAAALGQFYIAAGRLKEAEEAVRSGLDRDPTSQALRFLLASILEGDGNYEAAIAEYETLFAADPESTVVANNLASLLSERRGTPEALDKAYEIALRFRNTEIPQYLDTLGWIYYLRGEYPDALSLLKIAGEKLPNVGMVQYHLGMALKEVGQKALAVASLEKAVSLVPAGTPDAVKAQSELDRLVTPTDVPAQPN